MKPLISHLTVASLAGMFALTGAACSSEKTPTSTTSASATTAPSVATQESAGGLQAGTPTASSTHQKSEGLQVTPSATPTFASSTVSVDPTAAISPKPSLGAYTVGQVVATKEFFAKTVAAQKRLSFMKVTAIAPQYGTESTVYDFTGATPKTLTTVTTQGVSQDIYQEGPKIYYRKNGKWLPAKPSGTTALPYIAGGLIPDTQAFQKIVYRGSSKFEATVVNSQTKKSSQVFFTVDQKFNITELSLPLMKMTIKQSDFNKKVTMPKLG